MFTGSNGNENPNSQTPPTVVRSQKSKAMEGSSGSGSKPNTPRMGARKSNRLNPPDIDSPRS